jgi:hypothetical protein
MKADEKGAFFIEMCYFLFDIIFETVKNLTYSLYKKLFKWLASGSTASIQLFLFMKTDNMK